MHIIILMHLRGSLYIINFSMHVHVQYTMAAIYFLKGLKQLFLQSTFMEGL